MQPVLSFFQKRCHDGYAIEHEKPAPKGARGAAARILVSESKRFVPRSDRFGEFDVFKLGKPYLAFAKVVDAESAHRFVDDFGYPIDDPSLSVHSVISSAAGMREALAHSSNPDTRRFIADFNASRLGRSHVELRHIDGAYRIAIVPETLLAGMWIQLAQELASGSKIHSCQNCGTLFPAGASGRRSDARFCSEPCRKQAHYKATRSAKK